MQRTIADARRVLEDNAATVNPPVYRDMEAEITAAEKEARSRADSYASGIYDRHVTIGTQTGEALCTVRDTARRLAADLRAGRITAAEGTKQWNQLRAEARRLAAANERLAGEVDRLAAIEDDPVTFYDETIHAKYPNLRPNFTF